MLPNGVHLEFACSPHQQQCLRHGRHNVNWPSVLSQFVYLAWFTLSTLQLKLIICFRPKAPKWAFHGDFAT
jgi:hypothetical protein